MFKKAAILISGILLIVSGVLIYGFFFQEQKVFGLYKFNPFTQKQDYYEASTAGSLAQLGQIGDVSTSTPMNYRDILVYDTNGWVSTSTSFISALAGAGTVTSVALTVPTGLSISGSPITTSGTLALTFTGGYSIPLTASTTNGNTAYTWGNHASAGYYVGNGSAFATAAQGALAATAIQTELDPVWSGVSANYLLTSNAFTQALASTTFADKNLYVLNSAYYATTTHKNISSLPALSITKSQVSDLGTLFTQAMASTTFQPLEATLTDIADGTIAENLVNTSNPWADNEVADDITASNYILTTGFNNLFDIRLTATTSLPKITTLAGLSITKSQVSDFGTYESGLTAGDGLTRTVNDFDCDTASGSVFGCLSSANWTTFNGKQDVFTAGDALTLTGTDIDFDGGASPAGSLGGTWASPTIDDLFILNTGDIGTGSYTFPNASSTAFSSVYASTTSLYAGTSYIPNLGTAAGSFLAVNASGQIIATSTPTGASGYNSLADLQSAVSNDFHNLGGTDANTTYTGTYPIILTGTTFSFPATTTIPLAGSVGGTLSATVLNTDAVDAITEIAAALKDGSGDCGTGLLCLGDHTHSGYLANANIDTIAKLNAILVGEDVASTSAVMTASSDATWTLHNSYPAACGANTWTTTIGDTLTCSAITHDGITAMSSADFATLINDESGSGLVVLQTSPTLITPILGYASSTQMTISNSGYFATAGGSIGIATTTPGSGFELDIYGQMRVDGLDTATSTVRGNILFTGQNQATGCYFKYGATAGATTTIQCY